MKKKRFRRVTNTSTLLKSFDEVIIYLQILIQTLLAYIINVVRLFIYNYHRSHIIYFLLYHSHYLSASSSFFFFFKKNP